jgi:hypothetical protein
MRVYFISAPFVSNGFRRTYNKQLEVYSGVIEDNKVRSDCIYKYNKKEKKWIRTEGGKTHALYDLSGVAIHTTMPPLHICRLETLFASAELAQAAKLILIDDMKILYEKQLVDLKRLFYKNVPDVSEPLEELNKKYPEYFI